MNKIIIPANVTDVSELLYDTDFRKTIESITVEEGNPIYHIAGNCLIETESKTLVLGCKNSVIPDDGSVEVIGYYAFAACEGLKSIHIPASVTECNSLFGGDFERITVSPDNENFYSINDEILVCKKSSGHEGSGIIFACCKNIRNFTFSADIGWLGAGAFAACRNLESLTVVPENPWLYSVNNCVVDKKYSRLLLGCKNSVIPDDGSVGFVSEFAFADCTELTDICIPSPIESICEGAFFNCSNLTTVVLSSGIGILWGGTFENCNKLSRVFYLGTENDRKNITIIDEYDPINLATWYYYSEDKPEEEGNYWHYVDGEPTVW